ncbi:hypothetical protein H4Q26_016505 [Puccinia striiformis f. sp. tritici PST-130]|nr:hypothetical protein H4Q26_016505 [Puccinia striiformis f. sp. tritici PST-130]
MEIFLIALQAHIDHFLYHLIKSSAQWVNKPKVHMLLHLVESIGRFGLAVLFATEKFESFNGVLRKASAHSNKQAPGRDLATLFDTYGSIRFLFSGGTIYDVRTLKTRQVSKMVTSVFLENQIIQKSMGYNFDASHPTRVEDFPIKTVVSLRKEDQTTLPNKLADLDTKPNNISQIAQIQINKHDQVHKGVFVAVSGV